MEKFNGYVAQVYVMMGLIKGRTMLPLPSNKLTSSDITPDKDKAHIFEGSIITWNSYRKDKKRSGQRRLGDIVKLPSRYFMP